MSQVPSTATNTVLPTTQCNGYVVSGGELYHQLDCPMHGVRVDGFRMRAHDTEKLIVWPRATS